MSFQIYAFSDEASSTLEGQIRALKRHGLMGPELRNLEGKNVTELSLGEAKEIKKRLEEEGLRVYSLGSPLGKITLKSDLEPHLRKLEHTLDLAEIFGAECIRMFSFYLPEGVRQEDYREPVFARLEKMVACAKGRACLVHENEKGIYGDTPQRCLEIFQSFPEIKGVFDPANFVQCGQDPKEAWRLLSPYIRYLHIKVAGCDGTIVPPGRGDGEISYLLEEYRKQGGKVLTLEPHLMDFAGLAALEREGEKSRVGSGGYRDNEEAFSAAAEALKNLLKDSEEKRSTN